MDTGQPWAVYWVQEDPSVTIESFNLDTKQVTQGPGILRFSILGDAQARDLMSGRLVASF